MCGIFGAVFVSPRHDRFAPGWPTSGETGSNGRHESLDRGALDAALDVIVHRGPDARGRLVRGDVVLGHQRLAILDLTEAGAQPMLSAEGDVAVVFNGEIYNHHDLRDQLRAKGHVFRSRCDTEVLVEGYRAWGDAVVEKLDGFFAFGLVDFRRGRFLAARDRTGKKPFFYTFDGHGLAFASEIKSLVAAGLAGEMDPHPLPDLLVMGYVPAPHTLYKGVHQLAPATTMTFERGGTPRLRRYYRAPFGEPSSTMSVAEAEENVRTLVTRAVERRLEADVPVGAFLSGGVDSTIIVGIMAKSLGRPVKTFSIGFSGDARYDETAYARLAAERYGTEHTEFRLEPSFFDLVETLVDMHDGPFGDSSAIPTSVVSMLTRKHVTVALTGDGGDELFAGYPRFLAAEAVERLPELVRRPGEALSGWLTAGSGERTIVGRAKRFLKVATLPLPDRVVGWSSFFSFELHELLRPEWRRRLDVESPMAWNRDLFRHTEGVATLRRVLAHNFESYLPYDLLVKADRASMAHSLELRSPFLDTALIDFASRLPPSMLRRGRTTKWILKHAFRDLLPDEIRVRGKMGFGIPLGTWFSTSLRGYIEERLRPGALLYEYIEPAFVRRLLDAHFGGRADHGHRLWLLLTLEVWLRSLRARAAEHARRSRSSMSEIAC